jgi:hypothetical protein
VKFFNKELREKAGKRVERMDTPDLCTWMDSSLMALHAAFDEYRFRNGDKEYVTESLTALNAIWDELVSR